MALTVSRACNALGEKWCVYEDEMISGAVITRAVDQLVLGGWTVEKIGIGQKGIDIAGPKSINAMQLPAIPNANNKQTPDIWVTIGKSTQRGRYPVTHEIPKSSGWLRGPMRLAFKPLALDIRLSEEVPIVGCVNFGGLTTHVLTSYLS